MKLTKLLISLGLFSLIATGCSGNNYENDPRYEIYKLAVDSGFLGTYDEWLLSIKGKDGSDGHTPVIVVGDNGNWFIDGVDTEVKAQGEQGLTGPKGDAGDKGADGTSVLTGNGEPTESLGNSGDSYIDLNNWDYYVKSSTGWTKQGNIKGQQGEPGENGTNGQNGKSAYDIYVENYPGYIWDEKQWIFDLSTGALNVTISFETFGGQEISPLHYVKGEEINIDFEATKTRAAFIGWFSDRNLTTEIEYKFVAKNSLTLYAGFEVDKVSVKFMSNKMTYAFTSVEYGSTIVMPDQPVNLGYTFEGWEDNNGLEYNGDEKVLQDDLVLYARYEYDFLEIPAIIINTKDEEPISSKEAYVESKVSIVNTKDEWTIEEADAGVRGRGNSTWIGSDKKPYRIKFNKKTSVFGSEYKAKSWTLIANYFDKSLLRNYVALELSERLEALTFTSKHYLVDLYLNNEYRGVYLLCDQIQTGQGRVDIDESVAEDGNNGYFFERDDRVVAEGQVLDQDYFVWSAGEYAIKTPDTESEEFINNKETEIAFITNYLNQCYHEINHGTWESVTSLVDVDSFCEAYLLDELFMNGEINTHSSFFYKNRNGKLCKGPIWDYDVTSGNNKYFGSVDDCPPTGDLWCANYEIWYKALTSREEFIELLKSKIVYYRDSFLDVLNSIDVENEESVYSVNKFALERNFQKWNIMGIYVYPQPVSVWTLKTLQEQITFLKNWLLERYNFLYLTYFGEEYVDAYRTSFNVDSGVEKIIIYTTSDYQSEGIESLVGYSRDSSTGDPLKNGDGQINFEIVLREGYSLESVMVDGQYKNLKGPDSTGKPNTYRITKISSDLSIDIITSLA